MSEMPVPALKKLTMELTEQLIRGTKGDYAGAQTCAIAILAYTICITDQEPLEAVKDLTRSLREMVKDLSRNGPSYVPPPEVCH